MRAADVGLEVPRGRPGAPLRLGVALGLSLALHLWLLYGVSVTAPRQAGEASAILARLTAPPQPAPLEPARAVPAPQARPPARAAQPSLEPHPVPVAVPPAPPTGLPPVEMPLLADPTWYPARQLDVYPKLLTPVQPRYPEQADAMGIAGSVLLLVLIDENGLVREVSVAEPGREGLGFEDAATEAYGGARWVPALKDGRYVRSRVLVRVTFSPGVGAQARGQ